MKPFRLLPLAFVPFALAACSTHAVGPPLPIDDEIAPVVSEGAPPADAVADVGEFHDALAPYGDWTSIEPYGWVWVPRVRIRDVASAAERRLADTEPDVLPVHRPEVGPTPLERRALDERHQAEAANPPAGVPTAQLQAQQHAETLAQQRMAERQRGVLQRLQRLEQRAPAARSAPAPVRPAPPRPPKPH